MRILALDLAISRASPVFLRQKQPGMSLVIVSSKEAVRDLVQRRKPQRVVIEVCPLAGWVSDVVRELGGAAGGRLAMMNPGAGAM